jgi:hypothetical protein
VNGSGTIRVAKRDGTFEPFDRDKLAAAMYEVMPDRRRALFDSREVALAIDIYLHRRGWSTVSSAAVFEVVLKTFRRIDMDLPAAMMETHRDWRVRRRRQMKVRYADGRTARWDKGWLIKLICSSWRLGRITGRILAGDIEDRLMNADIDVIGRNDLVQLVNAMVVAYGLADAVPVEPQSLEA